jgi:hypothetical protein
MRYPDNNKNPDSICDADKAYIRFFHALPNDPPVAVDVYINKKLIVKNLKYEDFTPYLTAHAGTYIIEVYPTGNNLDQLLNIRIGLNAHEIATAAIIGTVSQIGLEVFSDYPQEIDESLSFMRFINLSPDKDEVNIYIDDTPVVYELGFTEITEYLSLFPGKHTMKVELSDSKKTIVSHPNLMLKGGNFYSTYVVGFMNSTPLVEALIPLEGVSYLKF